MYTVYQNERVRIRPFRDADEYLVLVHEELECGNEQWGPHHWPIAEQRRDFMSSGYISEQGLNIFAVEDLASGEVVGYEESSTAVLPSLSAYLGTFIRPAWQRRGYGVAAKQPLACQLFENYPFESLFAITVATHAAAIRGMELAGMRPAGLRPCVHWCRGRREATAAYQITRAEWEAMDYRHAVRRAG